MRDNPALDGKEQLYYTDEEGRICRRVQTKGKEVGDGEVEEETRWRRLASRVAIRA